VVKPQKKNNFALLSGSIALPGKPVRNCRNLLVKKVEIQCSTAAMSKRIFSFATNVANELGHSPLFSYILITVLFWLVMFILFIISWIFSKILFKTCQFWNIWKVSHSPHVASGEWVEQHCSTAFSNFYLFIYLFTNLKETKQICFEKKIDWFQWKVCFIDFFPSKLQSLKQYIF